MDRGWSPNAHVNKLGNQKKTWSDIFAKTAHIEAFKNVGDASTPIYMGADGLPRPVSDMKHFGGLSVEDGKICVTYNV